MKLKFTHNADHYSERAAGLREIHDSRWVHTKEKYLMNVVKFSVAKNQLKELLDQVEDDQDYTIISRHGAGDAVVMSMGYFTSLMETIYLLKSPANSAHLDKSIRQHQSGETISQKLAVD